MINLGWFHYVVLGFAGIWIALSVLGMVILFCGGIAKDNPKSTMNAVMSLMLLVSGIIVGVWIAGGFV